MMKWWKKRSVQSGYECEWSRGKALKLSIKYAAGTDHFFDLHYILNQQPSTRQAQSQARPSAGLTHAAEGQFSNTATFACNTSIVFVYFVFYLNLSQLFTFTLIVAPISWVRFIATTGILYLVVN